MLATADRRVQETQPAITASEKKPPLLSNGVFAAAASLDTLAHFSKNVRCWRSARSRRNCAPNSAIAATAKTQRESAEASVRDRRQPPVADFR